MQTTTSLSPTRPYFPTTPPRQKRAREDQEYFPKTTSGPKKNKSNSAQYSIITSISPAKIIQTTLPVENPQGLLLTRSISRTISQTITMSHTSFMPSKEADNSHVCVKQDSESKYYELKASFDTYIEHFSRTKDDFIAKLIHRIPDKKNLIQIDTGKLTHYNKYINTTIQKIQSIELRLFVFLEDLHRALSNSGNEKILSYNSTNNENLILLSEELSLNLHKKLDELKDELQKISTLTYRLNELNSYAGFPLLQQQIYQNYHNQFHQNSDLNCPHQVQYAPPQQVQTSMHPSQYDLCSHHYQSVFDYPLSDQLQPDLNASNIFDYPPPEHLQTTPDQLQTDLYSAPDQSIYDENTFADSYDLLKENTF